MYSNNIALLGSSIVVHGSFLSITGLFLFRVAKFGQSCASAT
jgi:hypothetical protein